MHWEQVTQLVHSSQMGDEAAMEELLLRSYGPVFYLASKILQDGDCARQVTLEVLEIISGKLDSLSEPEQFQKWMCRITAARCMQAIPLFQKPGTPPAARWQEELTDGAFLDEQQTAHMIQDMADTLPQNQRLCILLLGCGGLTIPAIAQVTGFSEGTVTEHLQRAQDTIQHYLWELEARNIQFSGLSSLTGILRIAMFRHDRREEALPVVCGILGKAVPVPPDPEQRIIRLLSLLLGLLTAGVMAASCALIWKLAASFHI